MLGKKGCKAVERFCGLFSSQEKYAWANRGRVRRGRLGREVRAGRGGGRVVQRLAGQPIDAVQRDHRQHDDDQGLHRELHPATAGQRAGAALAGRTGGHHGAALDLEAGVVGVDRRRLGGALAALLLPWLPRLLRLLGLLGLAALRLAGRDLRLAARRRGGTYTPGWAGWYVPGDGICCGGAYAGGGAASGAALTGCGAHADGAVPGRAAGGRTVAAGWGMLGIPEVGIPELGIPEAGMPMVGGAEPSGTEPGGAELGAGGTGVARPTGALGPRPGPTAGCVPVGPGAGDHPLGGPEAGVRNDGGALAGALTGPPDTGIPDAGIPDAGRPGWGWPGWGWADAGTLYVGSLYVGVLYVGPAGSCVVPA
ncbi:hypothetical protein [Fodinicola feengrottensis]|uniref:hypothetical protein n=1 Tax=Fodinicola feengrottensis TaxID=435914 RepID=UPI002442BDBC|nr:hypothetical protein [Fodinicola feengrottensis]